MRRWAVLTRRISDALGRPDQESFVGLYEIRGNGSHAIPFVPTSFVQRFRGHAANRNHFYLDSGRVRIGIGAPVADGDEARRLRLFKSDGTEATEQEKRKEWADMITREAGLKPHEYEKYATLRLRDDRFTTDMMLAVGSGEIARRLAHSADAIEGLDRIPLQALEALVDMAVTNGVAAVRNNTTLLDAIRAGDWARAAAMSSRNDVPDIHNAAVRQLFLEAGERPDVQSSYRLRLLDVQQRVLISQTIDDIYRFKAESPWELLFPGYRDETPGDADADARITWVSQPIEHA